MQAIILMTHTVHVLTSLIVIYFDNYFHDPFGFYGRLTIINEISSQFFSVIYYLVSGYEKL